MFDHTFEDSQEQIMVKNINVYEQSANFNVQHMLQIEYGGESYSMEEINFRAEEPLVKVKKTPKKRAVKYNRLGNSNDGSKEKRDVKKYARYDTVNEIFDKVLKKNAKCNRRCVKIQKDQKINKRSLRYFFVVAGVMQQQGLIENLVAQFKINKQSLVEQKYHQRSQTFKSFLNQSLNVSIRALELISNYKFEQAIKLAYYQNQKGVKGRTKNPAEMKKCLHLFSQTFLTSTSGQKTWI